uniref:Putative ovule protein n=1 Tax=Solanum chacoense TaxID=4108 RepID=A0A0V0HAN4_SOLCH
MANTNKYGDMGSSCLNPFFAWNCGVRPPLISKQYCTVVTHSNTRSIVGGPNSSNTILSNGHLLSHMLF